ncbi:signal recognition particle 68 [Histoplasma capsulatum var. duboisii H88]|uniref:Signal recognition particle subunit SRP68 n=1 Tax=Ajellomyces capsulatus (strain H88) TaxID=544711 RepID=F0UUT0_AJEC8|nr:signal recognition particle 68 [Histoplasma capsulatum var. duboisii H88]QSS57512.1 signal recognition particle 68 [Histoplasma capsulatum var. duboisii H88]
MDITSFIVSHREDALLAGDYNSYRAQLTRRLHTIRKKLGQTTPRGKKYSAKPTITAEKVANDTNFAFLILLCAERAWATAMHMKSTHSADPSTKGIASSARRHIISRLNKATLYGKQLVSVLQDPSASSASNIDLLEARGYLASLLGAFWMEKKRWDLCLQQYSVAKVIYGALSTKTKRETYRDLLSTSIDPGLRYAAYQLKLPRSAALESIAIKNVPSDSPVRGEVTAIDPDCFVERGSNNKQPAADGVTVQDIPQTITWRSRTVALEDAAISQALAAAALAEAQLSSWLSSPAGQSSSLSEKAANYDNVISASQDAVDATKTTIDELSAEGIDPADKRMQALQVTRTAVNYALVGWRVGRNRILCGTDDGLSFKPEQMKAAGGKQKSRKSSGKGIGRRLARLRESTTLYDATLQSLDFIQELPGVAGDVDFVEELNSTKNYFQSLRCLAVGRAHALFSSPKNALALFSRALDLASTALPRSDTNSQQHQQQEAHTGPPRLEVSSPQAAALHAHLQSLVWQYRGIVEIERLTSQRSSGGGGDSFLPPPMIERLHEYPSSDSHVDLTRLVTYPPKMEPVPVKPLFLDVAFNYIDYPRGSNKGGLATGSGAGSGAGVGMDADVTMQDTQAAAETKKEAKKGGWFGFGR